ncbi:MAG: outer membrane beta-barrel protein [Chryseolinea sp.]
MPKMTDQDFDNLFREAANRVTPEQQAGDWDDMQHRLEAAERDAKARNISLYSMLVLLLLYSFVIPDHFKSGRENQASLMPQVEHVEALNATETVDAISNADGAQAGTSTKEASTDITASTDAGATASDVDDAIAPEKVRSSAGTDKEEAAKVESVTSGQPERDKQSNNGTSFNSDKQQKSSSLSGSISNGKKDGTGQQKSSTIKARTIGAGGLANGDVQSNGVTGSNAQGKAVAEGTSVVQSTSVGQGAIVAPLAAGGEQPKSEAATRYVPGAFTVETPSTEPLFTSPVQKPERMEVEVPGTVVASSVRAGHPLFVKLAISPDFSSIDYGKAGKTGLNFGPMVEYGLSSKFSISTGAIWSKKLYDQENPKAYNVGGYPVKANMLNGDCRIIDIPLNLTYYMLPGRKTSVFVTVGTSSYIMLDETYVYTVSHNNRDYEYTQSVSNKNNEWFSMLNLSLGVQHQVAKRWFVQGEPFLKAPMKGVGEGKVNLVSAGVFVSVKYWINP